MTTYLLDAITTTTTTAFSGPAGWITFVVIVTLIIRSWVRK